MKKRRLVLIFLFWLCSFVQMALAHGSQDANSVKKGVWVTVFSQKNVLYSKAAAQELIQTCKDAGISDIYLQVYQSGNAYYDSAISSRNKYARMLQDFGEDPLDYILKEALENKVNVYAWVNLFSLGQNGQADIIKKFGDSVLTRDQYSRASGRGRSDTLDKYYLREDQLFLEPADPRVCAFILDITAEIFKRYPLFNGVHLDYARYPMTVPFLPGSKFTNFGLSYGYGKESLGQFKEYSGLDLSVDGSLKTDKDFLLWDDWRRRQITVLVKRIARQVKSGNSERLVSCAVNPSGERAYSSLFQDWPLWLEEEVVDYVVLMNYSKDKQLVKELARSALAHRGEKTKVHIGLGLFLFKDALADFSEQYKIVRSLKPDGIVLFSYDDLDRDIIASVSNP